MKTFLPSLALTILTGCAGTTQSITPAQINAAETAAQPLVAALAEKYPTDAAAINAGWGIVTALSQGAPVSASTHPALAALPAGTSSGSAIAATNTAIAILGTPGASQAARTGHLREFVRTHRILPAYRRVLIAANGDVIQPLIPK
jgi:hypothetical protein